MEAKKGKALTNKKEVATQPRKKKAGENRTQGWGKLRRNLTERRLGEIGATSQREGWEGSSRARALAKRRLGKSNAIIETLGNDGFPRFSEIS